MLLDDRQISTFPGSLCLTALILASQSLKNKVVGRKTQKRSFTPLQPSCKFQHVAWDNEPCTKIQ